MSANNSLFLRDTKNRIVRFVWDGATKMMHIYWTDATSIGPANHFQYSESSTRKWSHQTCEVWLRENEKRILEKTGDLDIHRHYDRP